MKFFYYILFGFWFLFSLLPLRLLYLLSDVIYFITYYLVRYRRKVVRTNLTLSFPHKSKSEILKIEKKFYAFFGDYIVETIKLFSFGKNSIRKRMQFFGVEELEKSIERGKSCIVYLGHYGNWEWITSLQLAFPKEKGVQCAQVYHPLENPHFDKLFLYLRGKMGSDNISMSETLRRIVSYRQKNQPVVVGFISDQKPFWNNIHHWTNFLNHPNTPVLTGVERIAKQTDFAVYYADMNRLKRGYYQCTFKLLTENPGEYKDFELTDLYFQKLQQTIENNPPYWLWAHDRWKRTREEFDRRFYYDENGHVREIESESKEKVSE